MAITVHDTLGAASVGFYVSCVIFGVFTTQVFNYFHRFPLDKLAYKLLVTVLWMLELVDQIFIAYSIYFYTITHFADAAILVKGDVIWTLVLQIVMGNLVGTIVKCCFAMRVWRFSNKNIYITGLIMFMILAQFGLAIFYCIRAFQMDSIFDASRLRVVASLSLGAGLTTDILIAISLCYFLRELRTGYRKADTLVNTLTVYAINTGALTGAVGLLTLILYNTHPETFNFMASYFTLGKLYAISFLCTLNTRKVLRGRGTDAESSGNNTSNARNTFFMVTNSGRKPRNVDFTISQTKSLEIGIHREVSVMDELEHAAQDTSIVQNRSRLDTKV